MNAVSLPAAALAQRIDALLPQTQCTRCGYPACLAYAQAIANDEADINQCPPGGATGIQNLAALLGREAKPLNPANGFEKPAEIAFIGEEACIGCTKCIQVCPVDAIIGASKMMHTILVEECTGCDLCIPACPVDCIAMLTPDTVGASAYADDETTRSTRAAHFRQRYQARETRLASEREERDAALAARKADVHGRTGTRSTVLDAIARAKARKSGSANP